MANANKAKEKKTRFLPSRRREVQRGIFRTEEGNLAQIFHRCKNHGRGNGDRIRVSRGYYGRRRSSQFTFKTSRS